MRISNVRVHQRLLKGLLVLHVVYEGLILSKSTESSILTYLLVVKIEVLYNST